MTDLLRQEILDIRRENPLTSTPDEKLAGELLSDAAEAVIPQLHHFSALQNERVGAELEFLLVQEGQVIPVSRDDRNRFLQGTPQSSDFTWTNELGAAQIEINQAVGSLFSFGDINLDEFVGWFSEVDKVVTERAHEGGMQVLSAGFHPTETPFQVERTDADKYRKVPNHHDQNRVISEHQILQELGVQGSRIDATAVALSQALQINISMPDFPTAVRANNRMFQMMPSILALTGGARFIGGLDAGHNDFRNKAWDLTHRTQSGRRVLLPSEGFIPEDEGIDEAGGEIFRRMGKFPMILGPKSREAALGMATGMNWQLGKMKFITDESMVLENILVEFRPVSIQPTPERNAAAALLSMGRLRLGLLTDEPLQDFETVNNNADLAMRHGKNGNLRVNILTEQRRWEEQVLTGEQIRMQEIHHAALGIAMAGDGRTVDEEKFMRVKTFLIENILTETASDQLAGLVGDLRDADESQIREVFGQAMQCRFIR